MARQLCSRQWRWLACAYAMFAQRGMTPIGSAIEQYFAPASKLRAHDRVRRTAFVRKAATIRRPRRDERVFEAVGTWAPRASTA